MRKTKTILFDLDGTLTDTLHPQFDIYRDGKDDVDIERVPVFEGAVEMINNLKEKGNQVFIVSDSHPRFVNPISEKIFKTESLSLAYKPTIDKIKQFIVEKSDFQLPTSRIFMVGDSILDISTARKLKIPVIHITHDSVYSPETWRDAQKAGPTFSCKSFLQLEEIIDDPLKNLLCIEGIPYSSECKGAININEVDYISHGGKRLYQIALARQDNGSCDIFAKSDWYSYFSSPKRSKEFLKKLAGAVGNYIVYFQDNHDFNFDILTYVSDKATTVPREKMKEFAELIECRMPIMKLLEWRDDITGSIRNEPKRYERLSFVRKYLYINSQNHITGKNIIMIDDQITTGATMQAVTEMLWKAGANHVLYISLFRMIDEIGTGVICDRCGKEMSVKNRKSDGKRFYSCTPPKYGGIGCGNIKNIN